MSKEGEKEREREQRESERDERGLHTTIRDMW